MTGIYNGARRPRKPAEKRKSVQVMVRMTPAQAELVRRSAKDNQRCVSEEIIASLFSRIEGHPHDVYTTRGSPNEV